MPSERLFKNSAFTECQENFRLKFVIEYSLCNLTGPPLYRRVAMVGVAMVGVASIEVGVALVKLGVASVKVGVALRLAIGMASIKTGVALAKVGVAIGTGGGHYFSPSLSLI